MEESSDLQRGLKLEAEEHGDQRDAEQKVEEHGEKSQLEWEVECSDLSELELRGVEKYCVTVEYSACQEAVVICLSIG